MSRYPAKPKMMERRMKRMAEAPKVMFTIPAILASEAKGILHAYYGSMGKAGLVLIKEAIYFGSVSRYWQFVFWLCDRVGWTKLVPIAPELPAEMACRHGGNCEYLNCRDDDCVNKSIPTWFQKLTRMSRS